ncbi:MAG: cation:proton antiporter, partial [Natrinema limicola]
MATETALVDVGVLFAAVALAGVVANRINQSVIPLYIVTGAVLGSNVLGKLPDLAGSEVAVGGVSLVIPE